MSKFKTESIQIRRWGRAASVFWSQNRQEEKFLYSRGSKSGKVDGEDFKSVYYFFNFESYFLKLNRISMEYKINWVKKYKDPHYIMFLFPFSFFVFGIVMFSCIFFPDTFTFWGPVDNGTYLLAFMFTGLGFFGYLLLLELYTHLPKSFYVRKLSVEEDQIHLTTDWSIVVWKKTKTYTFPKAKAGYDVVELERICIHYIMREEYIDFIISKNYDAVYYAIIEELERYGYQKGAPVNPYLSKK